MIWYYTKENILNEDNREKIFIYDNFASYEKVAKLVAEKIEGDSGDYSNDKITFLLMNEAHNTPIKCTAHVENIRWYTIDIGDL